MMGVEDILGRLGGFIFFARKFSGGAQEQLHELRV